MEKSEINLDKTNINWFPGHMTKAKRQMEEALKGADMVIELRDARIPLASANPLLDQLIQQKPRIIILTKADKADDRVTEMWIKKLTEKYHTVLSLDVTKDNLINPISKACLAAMKEKRDKQKARGINPRAVRAMVVGIPNVGKSTLINRLAKRKATKVANQPGVTRSITVITINKDLQLLDTPGVLWPKFDDQKTAYYLAVIGSINDNVLNLEDVAGFALDILRDRYPHSTIERYGVDLSALNNEEALKKIAESRNYVLNGEYDKERAINALLNDLRNDKMGKISWEYE